MKYPEFFNTIETIKLQDDLSSFLGSIEDGLVEFSYLDIVKAAGHSCPTVAGAYIMTLSALKELYKNEIPKRGEIFVSFKENSSEGTAGVIANVITQITGATESFGFKGLNGKFKRFDLMKFNDSITTNAKFQRVDTKESVEVVYNPNVISVNPKINILMQKMMQNQASEEEKIEFGKLWQERVQNIFGNIDKVIKIL
ncbi:FmdE family protein [Halarcobacter sp.]|uniref:FmdE family protein n=1 Tax=Halarcobacter sp. TaxID=2321133 RepID=UPI0029F49FD0|nr:FmdE family protein [Halarcobacter sp.]